MMTKRLTGRWVGLLVMALVWVPTAAGAQGRDDARFVPDSVVRQAFEPLTRSVRYSVVQLAVDGEKRALGTIVEVKGDTGYVLSKYSELKGDTIAATLVSSRRVKATLIGVDRKNDLAMLKIVSPRLKPVTLVTGEPGIGNWLACVGQSASPVAVGIVSAKARAIKPAQLMLGVALREDPRGLRVEELVPDFGAGKAGVKIGDVVTHVGAKKVIAVQQVVQRLQVMSEGDEVTISLLRDGRPMRVSVMLTEYEPDPRSRSERMNRMGGEISDRRRGFERVLQHDAELRPELCGGPIVNLKGEVVGLSIARAGRIATYALPSSLVKKKLTALMSGKLAPPKAAADRLQVGAGDKGKKE